MLLTVSADTSFRMVDAREYALAFGRPLTVIYVGTIHHPQSLAPSFTHPSSKTIRNRSFSFRFSCPGDVAKAFGAGADFVMLGGMLAGHDQSGGDIIEKNGKKFKSFYGMSSKTAMEKYHGQVAEYRASEGKTIEIPYRGDVCKTVQDVLGGLRSACTYTGASKLKELSKRATFIRVSQQTNEIFTPFEVQQK